MNSQSHITYWDAHERPLPDEALNRTVLYSTGLNSTPVVLERNRFVDSEFSDVMFKQHLFIVHTSRAITCEYKQRGSLRQFYKTPGTVSFFPSGEHVFTRLHTGKGAASTDLLLALDPVFVSKSATKLELDLDRIELIQQRRNGDPVLHHIALAMQNGIRNGDMTDLLYCEALSTALAFHLLREYGGVRVPGNHPPGRLSRDKLDRAVAYVKERLNTSLTVSEIAQVVGLSPHHFVRSFKASTGQSPHQYVIEARVRKAKDLLATGNFSIGEVAYQLGFVDQSHLTRHFKRIFGLPPKMFLNSFRRTFPFAVGAPQIGPAANSSVGYKSSTTP
jgi:AraC family transcriptional regulator